MEKKEFKKGDFVYCETGMGYYVGRLANIGEKTITLNCVDSLEGIVLQRRGVSVCHLIEAPFNETDASFDFVNDVFDDNKCLRNCAYAIGFIGGVPCSIENTINCAVVTVLNDESRKVKKILDERICYDMNADLKSQGMCGVCQLINGRVFIQFYHIDYANTLDD